MCLPTNIQSFYIKMCLAHFTKVLSYTICYTSLDVFYSCQGRVSFLIALCNFKKVFLTSFIWTCLLQTYMNNTWLQCNKNSMFTIYSLSKFSSRGYCINVYAMFSLMCCPTNIHRFYRSMCAAYFTKIISDIWIFYSRPNTVGFGLALLINRYVSKKLIFY